MATRRPTVLLAPGASGGVERLTPFVRGLGRRGIHAVAVPLPRGRTDPALVVYRRAIAGRPAASTLIGGHSFGGRVASLLAAETTVAGLVLFSYPLHPPGRSERWDERTAHWAAISCPVLLLSGESDPFAEIGLLRAAVGRLADAELVTYRGVGHGIGSVLDDALDRVASFVKRSIDSRSGGSQPS